MANRKLDLYSKNKLIFSVLLFMFSVAITVYFMPKKLIFNYEFHKNTLWQYDDLTADLDFGIEKTEEEIEKEQGLLEKEKVFYYEMNPSVLSDILVRIQTDSLSSLMKNKKRKSLVKLLTTIYLKGVLSDRIIFDKKNPKIITIIKNSPKASTHNLRELHTIQSVKESVTQVLNDSLSTLLYHHIKPLLKDNLTYDEKLTREVYRQKLNKISVSKGLIKRGEKIIKKGQLIDNEKFKELKSYKKEYERQVWGHKKQVGLIIGYIILITLIFSTLFLYLYYFEKEKLQNNSQLTFLASNILLTILLSVVIHRFLPEFLYLLPFCMQPIVIRSFFNQGIAIVTHIVTILIVSFIARNSFEFVYIQLIAGIITILTNQKLHQRVNLYISVCKIILIYELAYISGVFIQEGTISEINHLWFTMFLFFLSGVFTFLVLPLIYLYERIFGLTSDLSLLELSDSNHPLLRLLATEAPGTLQHSMQVANLAEEAAIEVGANALLVKVGSLYHDIGKLVNPIFFIENQNHIINPHDDLPPEKSAEIIIAHVAEGIHLAKKYRLPDRIIDFIRTHHGDTLVYYFYKKYKDIHPDEEVSLKQFKYSGPQPFSKETAILMICDSIEAASKTLKNPTSSDFEHLVNSIIDKHLESGQFNHATISLKEISDIKKVIINRLINIYHVRIEYPK